MYSSTMVYAIPMTLIRQSIIVLCWNKERKDEENHNEYKKKAHDDDVHIECIEQMEEDGGSKRKTPYPIFSLMSLPIHHHHHHVLSGSGDRYITIWEHDKRKHPNNGVSSWRIKAKLGPHTGWVKDLASSLPNPDRNDQDNEEKFIFSIGCNCIEVWRTINGESYDHIHKLMIESSVEMGSTLSSDILCLATSPSYNCNTRQMSEQEKQQDHHSYYLLAGGVDGRIHQWTICNNSFPDAKVVYVPGHDGRVNALLTCDDLRAAVSIGNDGLVKCWKLDCNESFSSVCSINVNDECHSVQDTNTQEAKTQEVSTIKLTCSCILFEQKDLAIIGIGTACGKVLLAEISRDEKSDDVMSIGLLDERTTVESSSDLIGGCNIHSIASQNNHIIIGHSKGISIWEPDLQTKHR
ncbi:hypothetical protein QTG54_002079 [Skeletonema marinoi]|uniref:Uncharacterized protein n=1 Tax=Skeletonema marinoi TaxID=267567 RepID=A0AAD8YKF7_9STRA|nr:hypothetical protein QTG54_002079 [Skeletonema marinoi]